MRRLSRSEEWGFAPSSLSKTLFPKRLPVSLILKPTRFWDWLSLREMDVVISRRFIRARLRSPFGLKSSQTIKIKDYIGVAVHYSQAPQSVPLRMVSMASGFFNRICQKFLHALGKDFYERSPAPQKRAVSLYLLHEDTRKDLLLYYSDHDNDIIALWQSWASKLSLPRLIVSPGGMIDEPFPVSGSVIIGKSAPRAENYALHGRRPLFHKVRGSSHVPASRKHIGREITARN